jgi:murein endopeptidase
VPALLAARSAAPPAAPLAAAPVRNLQVITPELPDTRAPAERVAAAGSATVAAPDQESEYPAIRWRRSRAIGVPHDGRLVNGVGLPVEGPDWVTWDPVLHRVPNRANRLYGTDALVRLVLEVIGDNRAAHPNAPRVVIGDLSLRRGGEIDDHASHENGLDVDIYYPRQDGRLRPPTAVAQIDLHLAQDLLDRFVAAGVQIVFVGQSTSLRGPDGIVVPYPSHDNHMHVRIVRPAASSG